MRTLFGAMVLLSLLAGCYSAPAIALTSPASVVSTIDAESTVLEGTSGPGAAITIRGTGDELYNTNSNEAGKWREEVQLARGRNDFSIIAIDPVSQLESAPLLITINRP